MNRYVSFAALVPADPDDTVDLPDSALDERCWSHDLECAEPFDVAHEATEY
jgi:hypothetical protein